MKKGFYIMDMTTKEIVRQGLDSMRTANTEARVLAYQTGHVYHVWFKI